MKANGHVEQHASMELLEGNGDSKLDTPNIWFSKRFYVTLLLFFGCANMYTMRANLSIAIVEMTSNKTITIGNQTSFQPPEYNWNTKTVGVIISMFSYGYLFSVFGGFLSIKYGGSRVLGLSMAGTAIITILNPMTLRIHFYLFLAFRVFAGILESFAYASSVEVISRWAPLKERSTLMSYSYAGIYVGTAITYPFCGFLAYKWGWPIVFYVPGLIALAWSLLWLIVVPNDPSKDRRISRKELAYIKRETENIRRKDVAHPYVKILMSAAFWALASGKFTYSVGATILVYCFPLYVKDATGRTTDQIGYLSSIPHIVCTFSIPLIGIFIDHCQNNSELKPTIIHKTLMSIGYIVAAALFVSVAYLNSFFLSMICFVLVKVLLSFNFVILQLVCVSMAPKHSSAVAGLSAFWYTASTILTPTVVGFFVVNHKAEEWDFVFLLTAGALIAGAVIFTIFGSSELQPWASTDKVEDGTNVENKNILKNYLKFFFSNRRL